jgi:hypothetical protein
MRSLCAALALCVTGYTLGKDYVVPVNDVAGFFAKLPDDATQVFFSAAAVYRCDKDIVLPKRQLLIIDGSGAKLILGRSSNGFTMRIVDQKEANQRTGSRYVIRDFAAIEGGKKAIDLQATLGSVVSNCRLVGQSEVALDLRFCLMARVQNVLVTNPAKRGIVVRHGDWPGATATNSQSNSTVLDQCRVYANATTTIAFAVLNTGGVRMSDCISEGAPVDYDLFLSATMNGSETGPASNPVVKSFKLENFHIEHRVRKASIYVNMPVKSSVVLSNVYWNGPQTAPIIQYVSGQLNIQDIGWFNKDFRIHTRVEAPRINVERSHNFLKISDKEDRSSTRAGVLMLVDPIAGNTQLNLSHVHVSRASW